MLFVVASSTLQGEVRICSIGRPGENCESEARFEGTHQKPVTCDEREDAHEIKVNAKGSEAPTRTSEGLTHIVVGKERETR